MWLSAIKLAVSAGSKIYANKQKTKMAMSEAQLMHATKMAEGQEAYQGKLLEARQSDWKDEAVLIILSLPVLVLAWAVVSDDPTAMEKRRKKMRQNGVRSNVRFPYGKSGMKKGGKVKKQGYKDRKDESIAMRIRKKRTPAQLKASRDESYGKFGSKAKKSGKINR